MQDWIKAILGAKRIDLYDPTPREVVDKMLELAELKEGEILYDLGCGDGRIVVTAAKRYGVTSIGIDYDPEWIQASKENASREGVADRVTINQADLFKTDLSAADVITVYLLPRLNVSLMPQLEQLKPGARILSHNHDMKGAKPKQTVGVKTAEGEVHTVYLWVVPWEKEVPEEDFDSGPDSAQDAG